MLGLFLAMLGIIFADVVSIWAEDSLEPVLILLTFSIVNMLMQIAVEIRSLK